jgi:hypothetical protein
MNGSDGRTAAIDGGLLDEISETDFPSAMQLDRIERLLSTREELETYIALLTQKVEERWLRTVRLLDRLERLLRVLKRVDQEAGEER